MLAFWHQDRGTNRKKTVYLPYPTCIRSRRVQISFLYIFCTLVVPLLARFWA
jgi:hypothetical protein